MMNKISLVIMLPVAALLTGVVFATFYHKYDTSRIFVATTIVEDLNGTTGNIVSLQRDSNGNILWIVSGKWQLLLNPKYNVAGGISKAEFESNLTMQKIDGKLTDKATLSNFKLKESRVVNQVVTLDGNASLIRLGSAIDVGNVASENMTVPLHIVISNARTISISSDSGSFHKYFEVSPVYGNVPQRE